MVAPEWGPASVCAAPPGWAVFSRAEVEAEAPKRTIVESLNPMDPWGRWEGRWEEGVMPGVRRLLPQRGKTADALVSIAGLDLEPLSGGCGGCGGSEGCGGNDVEGRCVEGRMSWEEEGGSLLSCCLLACSLLVWCCVWCCLLACSLLVWCCLLAWCSMLVWCCLLAWCSRVVATDGWAGVGSSRGIRIGMSICFATAGCCAAAACIVAVAGCCIAATGCSVVG